MVDVFWVCILLESGKIRDGQQRLGSGGEASALGSELKRQAAQSGGGVSKEGKGRGAGARCLYEAEEQVSQEEERERSRRIDPCSQGPEWVSRQRLVRHSRDKLETTVKQLKQIYFVSLNFKEKAKSWRLQLTSCCYLNHHFLEFLKNSDQRSLKNSKFLQVTDCFLCITQFFFF